jgi:arylsulfatase
MTEQPDVPIDGALDVSRRPYLLTLLFVVLCGCGPGPRPDGLPHLEDVNVLLIVVDTLAARHVDCLSDEALGTTPALDALAAGGVLFTNAQTPAPWTEPAIASLFTGRLPADHGVTGLLDSLRRGHVTLAEHLRERGFVTGGVISHFLIGSAYGFDQGYDEYDEGAVAEHTEITSHAVTDRALAFLDRHPDERFFLTAHYFDPHGQYNHHPEFDRTSWYAGELRPELPIRELRERIPDLDDADRRYLVGLYREEIAYTDREIGRLLDGLAERGLRDDTLVILVADHGEAFLEHGWIGHTIHLYDELLHVPLIVSLPGRLAPRRVAAPVSLLDVAPTLLSLSRSPADAVWDGVSLAPVLAGGSADPERELLAEVSFVAPKDWPSSIRSAFLSSRRMGDDKAIHDLRTDVWQGFDLAADPLESAPDSVPGAVRERLESWETERAPFRKFVRDRSPR